MMKKLLPLFLLTLLGLGASAPTFAQTISNIKPIRSSATLSAADAGTCAGTTTGCLMMGIGGYSAVSVQVNGNASNNTLQFEITLDPAPSASSVWVPLNLTPPNSITAVSSTTAAGFWTGPVNGSFVRVRMSTLVSSTAVVFMQSTFGAVARNFNGGTVPSPFIITANGLAATSTDGLTLTNNTAATNGVPVQISPRMKWCGTAWNSVGAASQVDCFILEALPVTNAGATTVNWNLSASIAGGAYTNVLSIQSGGQATFAGNVFTPSNGGFAISSRAAIIASASKQILVEDSSAATGYEINVGTSSLGTCTGGTLTSGSHNFAGEVTGTTGGTCVINFGAPTFTNSPFCYANDETAAGIVNVTARSASSITVSNITSGHAFTYACPGRIGT